MNTATIYVSIGMTWNSQGLVVYKYSIVYNHADIQSSFPVFIALFIQQSNASNYD